MHVLASERASHGPALQLSCLPGVAARSLLCLHYSLPYRGKEKKKNQTLHEEKEKDSPISKHLANLPWQPAKPLLNLPVWVEHACSMPSTRFPWQHSRQPPSRGGESVVFSHRQKIPSAGREGGRGEGKGNVTEQLDTITVQRLPCGCGEYENPGCMGAEGK